jgi:hypothetical protein
VMETTAGQRMVRGHPIAGKKLVPGAGREDAAVPPATIPAYTPRAFR